MSPACFEAEVIYSGLRRTADRWVGSYHANWHWGESFDRYAKYGSHYYSSPHPYRASRWR